MRRNLALLAVVFAILMFPVFCGEGDTDAKEVRLSDGISYTYVTEGYDYSTYRAEIRSAETDGDILFLSTTLEGYNVEEISPGALRGDEVRGIVIPERVETVGEGAFDGCPKLESVLFMGDRPSMGPLPDGVQAIRMPGTEGWGPDTAVAHVAESMTGGSEVRVADIFGEGVLTWAVPDEKGRVTVPGSVGGMSVDSVGAYVFAGRDNPEGTDVVPRTDVREVVLPDGLQKIRERAFYYSSGLESVDIPGSVAVIMDEAFRAAVSLADVSLPEGLGYIGFEAFRQCGSFRNVVIPDSVEFLGEGAFKLCRSAESLKVGSGIERIPSWGFAYMDSLRHLELTGATIEIGPEAFYMCGSLESAEIPDTVSELGAEAFYDCTSLERVYLGDSLYRICDSVFKGCSNLDDVVIPGTVVSVGNKAFAYCGSLEKITFEGDMPAFGAGVFLNAPVTIHVPSDHMDSWSGFDGVVCSDCDSPTYVYAAVFAAVLLVALVFAIMYRRRSA